MQASDRVVFGHSMSALLERCAGELTDEKWAELAALGVSRTTLLPAYEFELWCRALEFLARATHPDLEVGEAELALGREFIEKYANTLIGTALFALLRLLGTRRTIQRLTRSFRTGTSFTQIDISEETPTGCLLRFNIVEPRGRMTEGVLSKGLEKAGIPDVKVKLESLEGETATYRVQWAS